MIQKSGGTILVELSNAKILTSLRSYEDQETASQRGYELHARIYGRNPEFDVNATPAASPDYAFVVRDLLYGRVFSFDKILDDLETGYVIVSTLIGIDCQYQLRNHMKGMLYNGATREELQDLLDLCLGLAKRLGVVFRSEARPVPSIEGEVKPRS
jgi:alkylhydroperoxidase/carboxymuconolactone decarboxylase family protein YurZ